MHKLIIEVNSKKVIDQMAGESVMITPPIDEHFWLARINLFEDQYLLAFPKFSTIGIGFSVEQDWNTNLPYRDRAEPDGLRDVDEIRKHIWHNRRYIAIKKNRTNRAIRMLQEWCKEYMKEPTE
jgi:hypothetical protein